ncbi:MAG: hypothetical protein ABID79_00890 [Elusimicrobiota bacterium]
MESNKIANYIRIAKQIVRKNSFAACESTWTRDKQLGCKIYIVGGYVRDKILKVKSIDLDFVVEPSFCEQRWDKENGLKVAEIFHKELGGKLTVYKKFLTASLKLENDFTIDIATARTEKYPKPASMPIVQLAKLKKDLYRRDFTINAMALPIHSSRFAIHDVIDICGGLSDIKNKQIRVLHENSFTDDPTRIMRAIRYAVRFRFTIEKNTEMWMMDAIKKNLLSLVSMPRIRDEFIKTLDEKNAKKILVEFKKRRILKYIDGKLDISAISQNKELVKTRLEKLIKNFSDEQKKIFLQKLCLPSPVK